MKLAVWTPLPPKRSGIADYAYNLLAELARHVDVVAVVEDAAVTSTAAPTGVTVVGSAEGSLLDTDLDIYHIGNNAHIHGYIHAEALRRPGLLVLHDPALVDFYRRIGGGTDGTVFREEVRFNCPEMGASLPTIDIEGMQVLDAMALLMSRRLVEVSLATIAHSQWAAETLSRRSPGANVVYVPEATSLPDCSLADGLGPTAPLFGVFGGISRPKRAAVAVRAFVEVHRLRSDARLLLAGRVDDHVVARELEDTIARAGLEDAVSLRYEIEDDAEFGQLISRCTAVIALRWPTVGETSALVMRALGAGRVVVVSDVDQYRELDGRFCRRVSTHPSQEIGELVAQMIALVDDPVAALDAGSAARSFVSAEATFPVVARRHLDLARSVLAARGRRATLVANVVPTGAITGVNAIASWEATTGLTEAARRSVGALLTAGVGVAMDDFDYGAPRLADRYPEHLRSLPVGRPHPVDLCYLNINELHVVPDRYLRPPGRRRKVVASWFWELASIPPGLRAQIDRVDEIWVATEFVADVFRSCTSKPVHVVPCVVEPVPRPGLDRSDFGLPSDRCLFYFSFDANSTFARKNPRAVIAAYRRAFDATERATSVHLAMKTINLGRLPEAALMLRHEIESVGGSIVDEDLDAGEVAALTSMCDVYVSLHRAEGFGLGPAEAMYLGKPVIGTAYSGTADFMKVYNSCPVGYRMTAVDAGELRFNPTAQYVYVPGSLWAEPDVEEAARRMRFLFDDPSARARLGSAATATIRDMCSSTAVGRRMRELLATS